MPNHLQRSGSTGGAESALTTNERKAIQTKLVQLGYGPLTVDGVFGTGTRNAIRAFQQRNSLSPVDGVAGPNTQARLNSSSAVRGDAQLTNLMDRAVGGGTVTPAFDTRIGTQQAFGQPVGGGFAGLPPLPGLPGFPTPQQFFGQPPQPQVQPQAVPPQPAPPQPAPPQSAPPQSAPPAADAGALEAIGRRLDQLGAQAADSASRAGEAAREAAIRGAQQQIPLGYIVAGVGAVAVLGIVLMSRPRSNPRKYTRAQLRRIYG